MKQESRRQCAARPRLALPLVISLSALLVSGSPNAEEGSVHTTPETALVASIRHQAETVDATVGVSLVHLESGRWADYNADEPFPLASTYKIPMAATALSLVDRGDMSLLQMMNIPASARVGSSVITHNLPHPGVSLSLHNVMDLMLRESDNTATDVLLDAIGGADSVMSWLQNAGIDGLRVDRSTAQLLRQFAGLPEPDEGVSFVEQFSTLKGDPRLDTYFTDGSGDAYIEFAKDPQDQGKPGSMTRLLVGLWREELLSPQSTEVLQGIMLGCETGKARLPGRLPEGTPVAHKSGTISGTVNDVGVITLPEGRGRLVISVYVKNAVATREEHEQLIADIARTAYDYFVLNTTPGP